MGCLGVLKIAVFDLEPSSAKFEDVLVNILFDKCEFGYEAYTDPQKVLEIDFRNSFDFDIAFIEINSQRFPGIEVAKRIRESGNIKTEIIFISDDDSFALYGYKLKVFDYLIKPIPIKSIAESLERYFCYFESDEDNYFSFKVSGAIQKVRLDDIFYFTSNGRKCIIVNKRADYEFYSKLDEIETQLNSDDFIRVHQSYIVNIRCIKSLTKDGLTMNNGLFVPISQRRYSEVKSKFMKYLEIEE